MCGIAGVVDLSGSPVATDGASFRGTSDTEVVLEAYLCWGESFVDRIDRMFTLAIWDGRSRSLLPARDRFGIKPLYYALQERAVVFGSEIKAVLASGRIDRRLDEQGFHEYLYFGNPLGATTLLESVRQLTPGSLAAFDARGWRKSSYWTIAEVPPTTVGAREAVATTRTLLERVVRRHLVADVPVGAFLSGGVDSSAITAFASRHYDSLQTSSVGFDDAPAAWDELPIAKKIVLRRALRGIAPNPVLDRPKRGFGVPYDRWLRGPLADYLRDHLLSRRVAESGRFDMVTVEGYLDEHVAGRSSRGALLYRLLQFALWERRYLGDP